MPLACSRFHSRWWGLLPGLVILGLVIIFARDVPLIDEWISPGKFLAADARGQATFHGLMEQFIDARIVTLRLINGAFARTVGWRSSIVMILNALCQLGVLACLISALPAQSRPRRRSLMALLIAAIFVAPIKAYAFFWGFQLSVGILNLCLALGLFVVPRLPLAPRCTALAALATLATFSFASGLALWPLFLVPLLVDPHGGRRRLALAAYLVIATAVFVAFFTGYTRAGPPIGGRLTDPVLIARFFAAWLGHPFSLEGGLLLSQLLGGLALLALLPLARAVVAALRSSPERARALAPWLALLLYILATAALVALGRAHRGLDEAVRARYLDHAIWFPTALVGLAIALPEARRLRWGVLLSACVFTIAAWSHGLVIFDRHARYQAQNRLTLNLMDALPDNPALERIHFDIDELKDRMAVLRSVERFPMGPPLIAARFPEILEAENGGRVRIKPYGSKGWRLRGWAVIPDEERAADGVLILRRGSDGEAEIVTVLIPTHLRVRAALRHGFSALRSGFKGHYHRPLPGGLAWLEAFAIDAERGRAFPLVISDDLWPR